MLFVSSIKCGTTYTMLHVPHDQSGIDSMPVMSNIRKSNMTHVEAKTVINE